MIEDLNSRALNIRACLASRVGRAGRAAGAVSAVERKIVLDRLRWSRGALLALRRHARDLGLPTWAVDADDAELTTFLHHWLGGMDRIVTGDSRVTPLPADEKRQAVTIDYGAVALLPRGEIMRRLPDLWLDNYYESHADAELVETTVTGFSYLFDVAGERLVAAYGVSQGKHGEPRPSSRMRGHPLSAGPLYHRGHAIPHTLGGGTDINLLAQRGSINVGPFRHLENRAMNDPGAFYFTYWYYSEGSDTQTPRAVYQGLLSSNGRLEVQTHGN